MNFHSLFRSFGEFRKLILNLEFFKPLSYRRAMFLDSVDALIRLNQKVQLHHPKILRTFTISKDMSTIPDEYNAVILDMEGENPIKLIGLLIGDIIYSYLLPDISLLKEFYTLLFEILHIFKDSLFFGFTFWDYDHLFEMKNILITDFGCSLEDFRFLNDIKYFDLQVRDRESIPEALYSLGRELPRDPLYRRNFQIDQLWQDHFFDIIRTHNISCLKAELTLLRGRYLPQHLMQKRKTMENIIQDPTKCKEEHPR